MLSSEVFRFAKPNPVLLSGIAKASTVGVTNTVFNTEHVMEPINRALFDVVDQNGVVLNRAHDFEPDYWFEEGVLKVRVSGTYTLRVYASTEEFEGNVLNPGNKYALSTGGAFKVGIPFWPQVLSQPQNGIARVSNDGRRLAYVSQGFKGQVSFAYRLRNAYGQVSEPACANVTVI